MPDGLDTMKNGVIGFFWPARDGIPQINEDDPERGHVRIEGQWATVDVLEEDVTADWLDHGEHAPPAVLALTPDCAAVLLEIVGPSRTRRFGVRASSANYEARTVIGGLDVSILEALEPLALHAHIHGIGDWAGLSSITEARTTKPGGRLDSWTIQLKSPGIQRVKLDRRRRLVLSTHWSVGGTADMRTVVAPVTIGCEAERPTPTWDLLQPLLHVQNLLNVAFGGFVEASAGTAEMLLRSAERDQREPTPWMWNGALMAAPARTGSPDMNSFPLFTLETLGGLDALRRWVVLATAHPRAVTPVVNLHRIGPGTPAVTLLETAAGIEYWVKSHRPAKWTNRKGYASALAARVGSPFSDWVVDPEAWSAAFWQANNDLKHEATFVPEPQEITDLAVSGRYLLTAAILDQVARSKAASKAIFGNYRLANTRRRLHDRLGITR